MYKLYYIIQGTPVLTTYGKLEILKEHGVELNIVNNTTDICVIVDTRGKEHTSTRSELDLTKPLIANFSKEVLYCHTIQKIYKSYFNTTE